MTSVTTKLMDELRKTRKEMEKRATPRRYVVAWSGVTVNFGNSRYILVTIRGRYIGTEPD